MSRERASISIYLVDDDSLVRAGLRALLERNPSFEIVGEQEDARAAIEEVKQLRPDVIILDIALPGLSGVDAVAPLKAASRHTKVLIASHHQGSRFVQQALRAGADGYIAKNSKPAELGLAIESIVNGESYVSPKVAGTLVGRLRDGVQDPEPGSALDTLTSREREVFQLIAVGKANKEVAAMLDVSLSTVKKHRENLQRKLNCHSLAELTRVAIREGLLDP